MNQASRCGPPGSRSAPPQLCESHGHKGDEKVKIGIVTLLMITGLLNQAACAPKILTPDRTLTEQIPQIESRGKEIAGYERAATTSTDLLKASNPEWDKLGIYLAIKEGMQWRVYYGKLSDNLEDFVVAYSYLCSFSTCSLQPISSLSNDSIELASAIQLSAKHIATESSFPEFNPSAFREKDGTISVYMLPVNRDPSVHLIGGDFKFTCAPNGRNIVSKTKLHKTIIKTGPPPGTELKARMHGHVLTELPTETDVALAILDPQHVDHFVVGFAWTWRIDKNGRITVWDSNENIQKEQDKKKTT